MKEDKIESWIKESIWLSERMKDKERKRGGRDDEIREEGGDLMGIEGDEITPYAVF